VVDRKVLPRRLRGQPLRNLKYPRSDTSCQNPEALIGKEHQTSAHTSFTHRSNKHKVTARPDRQMATTALSGPNHQSPLSCEAVAICDAARPLSFTSRRLARRT
jgi:hypothetical protein